MKILTSLAVAMLAVGLLATPAFGSATIYRDCVSSTAEAYQFCASMLNFNFSWNYNAEKAVLEGLFETAVEGWHAVGFSSDRGSGRAMVGSNAIIGCVTEGDDIPEYTAAGADFFLGGHSLSMVNATGNQGLLELNHTQENGRCSVSFVRPLAPANVDEGQHLDRGVTRAIAAHGHTTLGAHTGKTYFDVDFADPFGDDTTDPPSATDPDNSTDDNGSGVGNTALTALVILAIIAISTAIVGGMYWRKKRRSNQDHVALQEY